MTRSTGTRQLAASARRRSERTHQRARAALARMTSTRELISVQTLAREAGVSRSWIYSQPELMREIEQRRPHPGRTQPVPAEQRASEESLRRRLEVAQARVRELESDNVYLRHALAVALGERRTQQIRSDPAGGR